MKEGELSRKHYRSNFQNSRMWASSIKGLRSTPSTGTEKALARHATWKPQKTRNKGRNPGKRRRNRAPYQEREPKSHPISQSNTG